MKKFFVFIMVLVIGTSAQSLASTSTVSGASVTKGRAEIEGRISYALNDEGGSNDRRIKSRIHLDYGFTNFYAARLVLSGDKQHGQSNEYDGLTLDNRFHVIKKKDAGYDFGVRLRYVYEDQNDKPDGMEFRLIEAIPFQERWELRLNQMVDHEIGENARGGLFLEARQQITYGLDNGHRIGLESLNAFGRINDLNGFDNQDHSAGLVLKGKFGKIGYETGYRVGLSDSAADHSVRLGIGRSF